MDEGMSGRQGGPAGAGQGRGRGRAEGAWRRFPALWRHRLRFWSGAVAAALVVSAFTVAANAAQGLFQRLDAAFPLLPFLLTPGGLALSVLLTRRLFPGAQGSGIPQTIAALRLGRAEAVAALLSLRIACGKMLLTVLGLCAGASIGREGPSVQVAAAVMAAFAEKRDGRLRHLRRTYILAGGAVGVAAAFNTPLAGILFAIEELAHAFAERTIGPGVIAVVLGGMVTLALAGNYTYFGVSNAALPWGRAWLAVALCGLAGGLLGALFSRLLTESARLFRPLGGFPLRHPVLFAALAGFILAFLGRLSGGATFGTGYEQARHLIEGRAGLPAGFVPLKLLATAVSYWSGIPGGIFAPSLAVGAGVGHWIARLLPHTPPGPIILLGMAAYFAGVVQAPLTAAVIVMEMTANPGMRLPLLAAAFAGFAAARLLNPTPLYRALAIRFLEAFEGGGAAPPPPPSPRTGGG